MNSVHVINNRTGSIMFGPLFYTEYAVFKKCVISWLKEN